LGRNPAASPQPEVFFRRREQYLDLKSFFVCDTDLIYSKKSSFFDETYIKYFSVHPLVVSAVTKFHLKKEEVVFLQQMFYSRKY
jgi:hypothetical protein